MFFFSSEILMNRSPPPLKNYNNFTSNLIGTSVINATNVCQTADYCSTNTLNKNDVLCNNCTSIMNNISAIYDNTSDNNIKKIINNYNQQYGSNYDAVKSILTKQLEKNESLNESIITKINTIEKNNEKLQQQLRFLIKNKENLKSLNEQLATNNAQSSKKMETSYFGYSPFGIGKNVSSKNYVFLMTAVDLALFGGLIYYVFVKKD